MRSTMGCTRLRAGSALGCCLSIAVAVLGVAPAAGQDAGAAFKITPYRNKTFGFSVSIPAGWKYDSTGFFGPGNSVGLLRGFAPGGKNSLQVLVFQDVQIPAFGEWVQYFTTQLESLPGVVKIAAEGVESAERPTGFVVVETNTGVERSSIYYFCVQLDPKTVWVYSLSSSRAASLVAEEAQSKTEVGVPPLFRELVASLEISYDPEVAEVLRDGLARGRDFLSDGSLTEAIRGLRIDTRTRCFLIEEAGVAMGYVTREILREKRGLEQSARSAAASEDGVRLHEETWRFEKNGAAQFSRADLFSAVSNENDLLEFEGITLPPAGSDAKIFRTRDQCVRQERVLFSSFTSSTDESLPDPRPPLRVDRAYLGLGWARLLPALMAETLERTLAFNIYDVESRTVIALAITPKGRRPLPGADDEAEARVFEVREGFAAPSLVFTDAYGNLLRVESGPVTMRLVDERSAEDRFGPSRRAAEARLGEK